jgi:hypothetical protein
MSLHADKAAVALDDGEHRWTVDQLDRETGALAARLEAQGTHVLATLMDNSPAWVVADRAAAAAQRVHVPLPAFFTSEQIAHALAAAGVDTVLAPPPWAARWPGAASTHCTVAGRSLGMVRVPARRVPMPAGTAKITFTVGHDRRSQGRLPGRQSHAGGGRRPGRRPWRPSISAATLRAAVCRPAGEHRRRDGAVAARCNLRDAAARASGPGRLVQLRRGALSCDRRGQQPHSLILLPQMLRAWVGHLMQSGRVRHSLKLVAVGGAAVGVKLLQAARAAGIPAYEGTGCPKGRRCRRSTCRAPTGPAVPASTAPCARAIAADGEVEVAGSLFLGYLGQAQPLRAAARLVADRRPRPVDADGFLHSAAARSTC